MNEKRLTKGMEKALIAVAYGVRKYTDGYRSIETTEKVDGRSLDALYRRGLIKWESRGGAPQIIKLYLTSDGEEIFEEKLRWKED